MSWGIKHAFKYWSVHSIEVMLTFCTLLAAGCNTETVRPGDRGHGTTSSGRGSGSNSLTNKTAAQAVQGSAPQNNSAAGGANLPPATTGTHLGIILGPGGAKTFAQIGALREIEKAQLPVEAIVGLEWGAVVGGLFSSQGRTNDVEWQMSKIKKEDFPQARLLQNSMEPISFQGVSEILKSSLGDKKVSDGRIKFLCPAHHLSQEHVVWRSSGLMRDAIASCAAYPPLFEPKGPLTAAPMELAASVESLRKMGINRIILINVLSSGGITTEQKFSGAQSSEALWREIRGIIRNQRAGVDFAIDLPTRGYGLGDIESARGLISIGQKTTATVLPDIISKLEM